MATRQLRRPVAEISQLELAQLKAMGFRKLLTPSSAFQVFGRKGFRLLWWREGERHDAWQVRGANERVEAFGATPREALEKLSRANARQATSFWKEASLIDTKLLPRCR